MASHGNFLVSSKCLPIWGSKFIALEAIVNWHSPYYSWRWRCKNNILPLSLIFPFNFWNLKICLNCETTFRNGDFLSGKLVSSRNLGPKMGFKEKSCGSSGFGRTEALKWVVYRWFLIQPCHIYIIHFQVQINLPMSSWIHCH